MPENTEEVKKDVSTLGMPKGSVRGIIALAVVLTFCIASAYEAYLTKKVPTGLVGLASAIAGYYFGVKKSGGTV